MNWPGLITAAAVWAFFMVTIVWPVCVLSKRQDAKATTHKADILILGNPSDRPVAEALRKAVEDHINRGGNLDDVLSWYPTFHPSGACVVTLVTAGDVVDEAEAVLRAGGAG